MPRAAAVSAFVRYVSPFGSPASMPADRAEQLLAEDTAYWEEFLELGLVTETQLRIGPPRIGDTLFRLSELPEWVDGDTFDVIRPLVRRCESLTRDRGRHYVVVTRAGRAAVIPAALVIEGDAIVWEAQL